MAQKGSLKLVEKYQFDEKKFIKIEGIDWFQAIHTESKQAYTLKRVCLSKQTERDQSSKIMNELTLLKKLHHPLIPKCHKLFKTSNNMYLIYDKIPGITLEQFVKHQIKNMDWQQYKNVCLKVSEELLKLIVYLKDKKICHSYINFNNVLVDTQNISKVINYTCAQELTSSQVKVQQGNENRFIDEFCPPQVKNGIFTNKTDTYSVGVILLRLFSELKQMKGHTRQNEGMLEVHSILSFCKKMTVSQVQQRMDAEEALKYFENKLFQQIKQDNTRNLLLMTDPGVTGTRNNTIEQSRKNISRFHSPAILKKNQFSEVGSQTQEYFHIARKVLNRRNMSQLLLELSQFCLNLPFCSSQKSNPLAFLMLKKSALISSQIARFLETGRGGQGLKIDDRIREKLKRHKLFINLEKNIHKQMKSLKDKLSISMESLSENIQLIQHNKQLQRELAIEAVDNDYFRKCAADLQHDILAWQQKAGIKRKLSSIMQKKELVLFFILTLLTEYTTIEQIFQFMLCESGSSLWKGGFFVQSFNLSQQQLQGLILMQGKIVYPKHVDSSLNVSSRQIHSSRRNL